MITVQAVLLTLAVVYVIGALLFVQRRTPRRFNWRLFLQDTTGGVPFDIVSKDAQRTLEEFDAAFEAALVQGATSVWSADLGLFLPTKAILTTLPVPIDAAGYKEFKGNVKYRQLYFKSMQVKSKTWQDGVAELASIIEAPDFIGWAGAPDAMASAAQAVPNDIIAGLLEANGICWDDQNFFDTDHPVNYLDDSFGTFINTASGGGTAASTTALETAKANMRKKKAPNGKPMGLKVTHILAHPDKEETWRNILDRDIIIESFGANNFGPVDNRHKNSVKLVICDEFTVSAQWYALAANKPGMVPWMLAGMKSPESRVLGKDSALYEKELKLGFDSWLTMNGALALPHCIDRYVGS